MTITPLVSFSLSPVAIVLIVIAVILIGVLIFLGIWGSKQQKKADAQQAELQAAAQPVSMLVIDKKRMKLKEAGLPKIVVDSTPKYLRRAKVPVVKAKVGSKIMTLISDEKIFDLIPIKQEIKASVSGIYIISVKNLRGPALTAPVKQGFFKRMKAKVTGGADK